MENTLFKPTNIWRNKPRPSRPTRPPWDRPMSIGLIPFLSRPSELSSSFQSAESRNPSPLSIKIPSATRHSPLPPKPALSHSQPAELLLQRGLGHALLRAGSRCATTAAVFEDAGEDLRNAMMQPGAGEELRNIVQLHRTAVSCSRPAIRVAIPHRCCNRYWYRRKASCVPMI